MLRALSELTRLSGISDLGGKVEGIKFNATLPITIKVKEQLKPKEFLLDIGRREQIKTKSELPLDVGKKYWGVLRENQQTKQISLSNLLKQPTHLQHSKNSIFPSMTIKELREVLESKNPKESLKFNLLTKLANTTSKQEFLQLTNSLNALQENIFTMVLTQNHKESFLQFKKRRSKSKRAESNFKESVIIDFYAAFENLGPIEGVVEMIEGEMRLKLFIFYENSLIFLQKRLKDLDLQTFLYKKEGNISPLYEYPSSLLDVKG